MTSRLTMLATQSGYLSEDDESLIKPVKLISFTPGTSFDKGWSTGRWEERALLFRLLEVELNLRRARRTAAMRLLKQGVGTWQRFDDMVEDFRRGEGARIDPDIHQRFLARIRQEHPGSRSLMDRFDELVTEHAGRSVSADAVEAARDLIGEFRGVLAHCSIETLEPDLVILDEFQRFRDLLDERSDAGELAHAMFNYPAARVLLLSATPFKPYTLAEEEQAGDSHHEDFMRTLSFLAAGRPDGEETVRRIDAGLRAFREAVLSGTADDFDLDPLQRDLLTVMCRSERPVEQLGSQVTERVRPAEPIRADELVGYAALRALSRTAGGAMQIEYWKSTPYFANFMEGYQLRERVWQAIKDPTEKAAVGSALARTRHIDPGDVARFAPIDFSNAKLRVLASDTVDRGWERLLWVPPTLPYLMPGAPFDDPLVAGMTKRLIFSSWSATPTAIASLLSHEASRKLAEPLGLADEIAANTAEFRKRRGDRLSYRLEGDRPAAMTTLALFWPIPGLADLGSPLHLAHENGRAIEPGRAVEAVQQRIGGAIPQRESSTGAGAPPEQWTWVSAFGWAGSRPDASIDDVQTALAGSANADDQDAPVPDSRMLRLHVEQAFNLPGLGGQPPDILARHLAELAVHSPANCAWRALGTVIAPGSAVTSFGRWQGAATLASGIRTLFSRAESTMLLDGLYGTDEPYWQRILRYCAAGNLQSVLDEYLYHLRDSEGITEITDATLLTLARRAAEAMSIRPATYRAFNPADPDQSIGFLSRFALRYSGGRQQEASERPAEVRHAFNSPFWPFVLATTSVGQEGIDFHWWCHSLVHWNIPSNPVDFEQREGRVNRYRGHAIRRNIMARHGDKVLEGRPGSPWDAAYHLAEEGADPLGGLSPDWIYPGATMIARDVLPYPLSVDDARLDRIKSDLALYRLTFGQPRQEDLVQVLRSSSGTCAAGNHRLDLTAPAPAVSATPLI